MELLKEHEFPQVRSFASSSDAALKKKGYETELANHEKTELSSAEAINAIKGAGHFDFKTERLQLSFGADAQKFQDE